MIKWKTFNPTRIGFTLPLINTKSICHFQHTFNHLVPELNSNWNLQTPGLKSHSLVFYANSYTKYIKSKRKKTQQGCKLMATNWMVHTLHQYGTERNTLQHSTSLSAPNGYNHKLYSNKTALSQYHLKFRLGARFSAPIQAGPGAYPASCTIDTTSFPGVKWLGHGADHPPPSKHQGHEKVGLYLYSPSGSQWPVIRRTFTFTWSSGTELSFYSEKLTSNKKIYYTNIRLSGFVSAIQVKHKHILHQKWAPWFQFSDIHKIYVRSQQTNTQRI